MTNQSDFTAAGRARFFEDYIAGTTHVLGSVTVDEAEVVEFAGRYDPQSIHTDREAAIAGPFGGLIASGWQTAGLMMSLYATRYLSDASSIASPGMDDLRWLRPVRPGDQLTVTVNIVEATRSRSKPDRGVVRTDIRVSNQDGDDVMSMLAVNMISCREPG